MTLLHLSQFGLCTVEEAAAQRGVHPRTVRNWIAAGLLPAVCAAGSDRPVYLVRIADVKRAKPAKPGRRKKETGK